MKRYNLYFLLTFVSLILFSSCHDDETFDNNIYMNSSSKVFNLLIKSSVPDEERILYTGIAKPESQDIAVRYETDSTTLVKQYNKAYYDNAVALPSRYYKIPEASDTIQAGSVRSIGKTIYFNNINELNPDTVYVLPVSIKSSNLGVLESARTNYFVIRSAAMINVVADLEENYLHIDKWVKPEVVNNLSEVTMEALIRCRNYDRLISTVMGIENYLLIRIGDASFPSNQIQIATNAGNFPDSDTKKGLPTNEWIHIALTYNSDNGEMKVYVNGKVQSESTKKIGKVNFGINGGNGFYIGRSYEDSRFLAGEVSECRIWNVVRTKDEIANNPYQVAPDSEGLVAYWKCDEGGGSTVKDYTGNGNHMRSKKDIKWIPVSLPAKDK